MESEKLIVNEFGLSTRVLIHGTTIGDLVDQYVRLIERIGPITEEDLFDRILVDWRLQFSKNFEANEVVGIIVRFIIVDPRVLYSQGTLTPKKGIV